MNECAERMLSLGGMASFFYLAEEKNSSLKQISPSVLNAKNNSKCSSFFLIFVPFVNRTE